MNIMSVKVRIFQTNKYILFTAFCSVESRETKENRFERLRKKMVVPSNIPEFFSRSTEDPPAEDRDFNPKLATVLTARLQGSVNKE